MLQTISMQSYYMTRVVQNYTHLTGKSPQLSSQASVRVLANYREEVEPPAVFPERKEVDKIRITLVVNNENDMEKKEMKFSHANAD